MNHHKRTHNSGRYYPNSQPPSQQPPNHTLSAPPQPYTPEIQRVHLPNTTPPQPQSSDQILVVYSTEGCDYNGTRGKRYPSSQVKTLADFKQVVFTKSGMYR